MTASRERLECLTGLDEDGVIARGQLVPSDDHVDIERIELNAATDAAGLFGGNETRPGVEERVDDDFASVGTVSQAAPCGGN